jgi:hypothetical protein
VEILRNALDFSIENSSARANILRDYPDVAIEVNERR